MEEKQDKKPVRHEFVIPKQGRDGKPLKNAAGDIVNETYVYDFAEMGMDRKLMARKFFHLSAKNLANLPKEPEHIAIIADRQTEIKAFSAILMKVLDDGSYEPYDPSKTELSPWAMSNIGKTPEQWQWLEEIQTDFFGKVGLQSTELMLQSNGIMMQSLGIMTEITNLASQSGITGLGELKEFTQLILQAASENAPGKS